MLVEAVVTESDVKVPDEPVLLQLARREVVPAHTTLLLLP